MMCSKVSIEIANTVPDMFKIISVYNGNANTLNILTNAYKVSTSLAAIFSSLGESQGYIGVEPSIDISFQT